jgi:hypothetical protein
VFKRRASIDKIIKVKASKPRAEKVLTLFITRQGPMGVYTEVLKRDALIALGYTEWEELLELARKQTSALSSELMLALQMLIKKVQRLELVPSTPQPQRDQASSSVRSRVRRSGYHAEEEVFVLDFGSKEINNSLPMGVDPIQHLFITEPEHGIFYLDKNHRMCFQRTAEIPKAPLDHLVGLRQGCMGHEDLEKSYHILIAIELLNRRTELLNSPHWPVKIEAEAELEDFQARGGFTV